VLAFLFALLPLPFTVVRLAAFRNPPRMIPFQVTVAAGRFPRYLVTVLLWPGLGLPSIAGLILLAIAIGWGALQWVKEGRGHGRREEMVIVQRSIVTCHRWLRFAQSFLRYVAPKAHPKMTTDN
jgi:hypothetical protein